MTARFVQQLVSPCAYLLSTHLTSTFMLCRKTHLFDIDIPGKIMFKESTNLSPGQSMTIVDTEVGRLGIGICYDLRCVDMRCEGDTLFNIVCLRQHLCPTPSAPCCNYHCTVVLFSGMICGFDCLL